MILRTTLTQVWPTLLAAGMLFLELSNIVHILIHDEPEIVGFLVCRYIGCFERLRHDDNGHRNSFEFLMLYARERGIDMKTGEVFGEYTTVQ